MLSEYLVESHFLCYPYFWKRYIQLNTDGDRWLHEWCLSTCPKAHPTSLFIPPSRHASEDVTWIKGTWGIIHTLPISPSCYCIFINRLWTSLNAEQLSRVDGTAETMVRERSFIFKNKSQRDDIGYSEVNYFEYKNRFNYKMQELTQFREKIKTIHNVLHVSIHTVRGS